MRRWWVCATRSTTDAVRFLASPSVLARSAVPARGTIRVAICGLLLLMVVGLSGCTSVFLFPDRKEYFADRPLAIPVEEAWIPVADGEQLHALVLPAPGTSRATVLFLHGNAENLSSHVHAIAWMPARGYSVLAIDYRGYGRSQGKAGIDSVHQDALTALAWLAAREPKAPLVVYGQSLGGSVALRTAAKARGQVPLAAVIAESAFSSYRGIAREKLGQAWLTWPLQWPLSWLISDRYAAIDVVDRIAPTPLLLIHGERDAIVAASHARRLYEAAGEPRQLWLIPDDGHIDAARQESFRVRLINFLDAVTGSKPAGAVPAS